MMTVMVPDLLKPTDEIRGLCVFVARDLHEVPEAVHDTMACLLKTREDKARMTREVTSRLLAKVA